MAARPFLERLGEASLATLRRLWLRRRRVRGEPILFHGETDRDVFFVIEGRARASVSSADGKSVAFKEFVAGDVFGEFSAIDGAPRSANVVAVTDMTVARLPAAGFERLVAEDPGFAWALLRHVTELSREMNARVVEYSTMLVRERLVRELIRLARIGVAVGDGVEIAPPPTHQDIAARISTHREAVSREMSRLAKAGLLGREAGKLVIPDLERLRRMGPETVTAPPPAV